MTDLTFSPENLDAIEAKIATWESDHANDKREFLYSPPHTRSPLRPNGEKVMAARRTAENLSKPPGAMASAAHAARQRALQLRAAAISN
jgi:hypothetical protein